MYFPERPLDSYGNLKAPIPELVIYRARIRHTLLKKESKENRREKSFKDGQQGKMEDIGLREADPLDQSPNMQPPSARNSGSMQSSPRGCTPGRS